MPDIPVIDAHVHIQPWKMVKPGALELLRGKRADHAELFEVMYDPSKLLKLLDRERLERIVTVNYVSPDIMGFTEEVNRYAADYARRCEGRVIPLGSVHPNLTRDPAREVDDLVRLGIRGIKFHPSHQPCFPNAYRQGHRNLEVIYRACEEAGLVLMIHTGTSVFPGARNVYADPIYCDDIGVDFPRLRVILAHGGRPLWTETATFLVRRHPNFWMDLSSIPPQNILKSFPRLDTVADKVLWGSDWPAPGVPGMRANVDRFLELPLAEDVKRKILCGNARRLYELA